MARITVRDLYLTYPVISKKGSLRNAAVDSVIGGFIHQKDAKSDIHYIDALKGICLDAEDGDRIGLVGHNGAGKSSLLKVISGIFQPSRGNVDVDGDVESLIDIGFGIDPEETGLENILFVFEMLNVPDEEIKARAKSIVDFTELGDFINMPVRTYSSGMATRLSFALATSIQPEILLMDEVIGAGDAQFYEKSYARLQELTRNTKIIFLASHSNALLEKWCNKAIWLDKGEIREAGFISDVLSSYAK